MSILEEKNENVLWINTEIKGMPISTFKEFKKLANEYNGSYPVAIKVLLERNKILNYLIENDELNIEEVIENE